MHRRVFFGRNGGQVTEVSASKLADLKPQLVLDTDSLLDEKTGLCYSEEYEESLLVFVQDAYVGWGRFGSEGDIIAIESNRLPSGAYMVEVKFIGRLQRPKPSLAADIIPVVIDSTGNSFFVLIHRKWDPGKGKIALVGGNEEVVNYYFQTPAATLQMEAEEEIGLTIAPYTATEKEFFHYPFIPRTPVMVVLNQPEIAEVDTELILLRTYETSVEEERPHLQAKRINWTTAYLLPIRVDFAVSKGMLMRWFRAGDDAEKLAIVNLTSDPYPEFGIGHHGVIFKDALRKLQMLKNGLIDTLFDETLAAL